VNSCGIQGCLNRDLVGCDLLLQDEWQVRSGTHSIIVVVIEGSVSVGTIGDTQAQLVDDVTKLRSHGVRSRAHGAGGVDQESHIDLVDLEVEGVFGDFSDIVIDWVGLTGVGGLTGVISSAGVVYFARIIAAATVALYGDFVVDIDGCLFLIGTGHE
jgi:hypothetical protein